ncbi:lipopolysaccharide kinase [Pseudomonas sp. M47T1]|uniref:lipopolysaccharide kinase InaA family protein n=1 Tax=Pseudomonas sp. M47T1 TaxID=1179778 RepID=UPI0002606B62|nr:lipopolysaccharide kinase InaA family protein [Pseudomonas sp. M47T1]EIK96944.1 lipopolysaccharide kinase [Pseudomonas sp. M47T1]
MSDFFADAERGLLERHGLASFDTLWTLQLDPVDEPNTARGGYSQVFRLELEGKGFYLKRQRGYLTRTLHHPFGEPTFSREFRNIRRYQQLAIPALQAAYYGERKLEGDRCAILMTRALDGWTDLDGLLVEWGSSTAARRQAILAACGTLARTLHGAGQVHGCFYPKHIFLRQGAHGYQAQLIDLEKTRPALFGRRDRVRDLEPLLRRAPMWGEGDIRVFLAAYLNQDGASPVVQDWLQRLTRRRSHKEGR